MGIGKWLKAIWHNLRQDWQSFSFADKFEIVAVLVWSSILMYGVATGFAGEILTVMIIVLVVILTVILIRGVIDGQEYQRRRERLKDKKQVTFWRWWDAWSKLYKLYRQCKPLEQETFRLGDILEAKS